MKGQQSLNDIEYGMLKHKIKREVFLDKMESVIHWDKWCAIIEPFYYKGEHGRPPRGIEFTLRMYLLQVWFNLSAEGTEANIHDIYAFRKFKGINFAEEQVPYSMSLQHFCKLLEDNNIGEHLFAELDAGLKRPVSCTGWALLLTPPSSLRPVLQRMRRNSGILRCTRPRRTVVFWNEGIYWRGLVSAWFMLLKPPPPMSTMSISTKNLSFRMALLSTAILAIWIYPIGLNFKRMSMSPELNASSTAAPLRPKLPTSNTALRTVNIGTGGYSLHCSIN